MPAAEGRFLPNSPKHNFNLYTRYAFQDRLKGFYLGGSADYLSDRYSSPPQAGDAGMLAEARTLIGLFAGYRVERENLTYRLQLNLNNVTDEYVAEGHWLGRLVDPRSYRVTAGFEF